MECQKFPEVQYIRAETVVYQTPGLGKKKSHSVMTLRSETTASQNSGISAIITRSKFSEVIKINT